MMEIYLVELPTELEKLEYEVSHNTERLAVSRERHRLVEEATPNLLARAESQVFVDFYANALKKAAKALAAYKKRHPQSGPQPAFIWGPGLPRLGGPEPDHAPRASGVCGACGDKRPLVMDEGDTWWRCPGCGAC